MLRGCVNFLSIQSHVVYGHVGNSAVAFALQRLGHECWPLHTVQLSNHTGYPTVRGRAFDAALIVDCVSGLDEVGALAACDGLATGYAGTPEIAAAMLDAAQRLRSLNADALWCCDPVMGDAGRFYVKPGVAEFLRDRATPQADIVTPNPFELEVLAGAPVTSLASAADAMRRVAARGPRIVLLTSFDAETPPDAIDMLALAPDGLWRVRMKRFARGFNGAGDLSAALFLVFWREERHGGRALARMAASVHEVLVYTAETGARELAIIAAQDAMVRPRAIPQAEPLHI